MLDLIIKNGTVYDGTGRGAKVTDIGVKNGRIVEMGMIEETRADKVFSADGLFVIPSMIDAHTHADYLMLEEPVNLDRKSVV